MNVVPQRILVGVSVCPADGKERLEPCPADLNTARQALALAEKVGATLRLVHVVDWIDDRVAEPSDDVISAVRSQLDEALDPFLRQAATRRVPCSLSYASGKPWREILGAAHEWKADVIALSPRRDELSFGDRIIHGSTASRILRKSACSVWVVDRHGNGLPRRIMALVDRSEVSETVMRAAQKLGEVLKAEKYVLHCLDYPDDIVLNQLPNAREAILRYHHDQRERARADLARLSAQAGDGWTVILDEDWVVRRCPKIVREHSIDLVVLAGASQPRLAGVLLGTTAERLLQRFEISAWVVRPEDWSSPLRFES